MTRRACDVPAHLWECCRRCAVSPPTLARRGRPDRSCGVTRAVTRLARGDADAASETLQQAFARACQLGDPCWEGIAARGLALVAEVRGETGRAFDVLSDARDRCNRLADPYVWLDVYILDALCTLGLRHGRPHTIEWVDAMQTLAARTAMREFTVRAMLHHAALGGRGDAASAALLAADIDNPRLHRLTAAHPHDVGRPQGILLAETAAKTARRHQSCPRGDG